MKIPKKKAAKKAVKLSIRKPVESVMLPANPLEPVRPLRNPNADTYRNSSSRNIALPAELQFQLSKLAPDTFSAPFVENGNPLDIPTMRIVGNKTRTFVKTSGDNDLYCVIFNVGFPAQWYDGTSGLNTFAQNNADVSYNSTNVISCDAFTSFWGDTSSFFDKLYTYSTVIDCEIMNAEATISGVVHVGSIALSSFVGGVKISQLIQQADRHYDCKDPNARVIRLRSAISNRSAIHTKARGSLTDGQIDVVADEYISYAIYHNPVVSLLPVVSPETSIISCNMNISGTAQCIWWPEGSKPMTKGLAMSTLKPVPETKILPVDQENSSLLERIGHLWTEPNKLEKIVSLLCSRKSIKAVMQFADRFMPGLANVASMVFETGFKSGEPLIDDISALKSCRDWLQTRLHFGLWTTDDLIIWDQIMESLAELCANLASNYEWYSEQKSIMLSGRFVETYKHGEKRQLFLKEDGTPHDFEAARKKFQAPKPEKSFDRPQSVTSRR